MPLVDAIVREMHSQGYETLDQTAKAELLEVLNTDLMMNHQVSNLSVMVEKMLASLVSCFEGKSKMIDIPTTVGTQ